MIKKDKIEKAGLPVVCVFKDLKANIFTAPMVFDNEACAERYFSTMVDKMGVKICDYDLFVIGHYYDKSGEFLPLNDNAKFLLKSGIEYRDRVDALAWQETKIKLLSEEVLRLQKRVNELELKDFPEPEFSISAEESEVNVDEE